MLGDLCLAIKVDYKKTSAMRTFVGKLVCLFIEKATDEWSWWVSCWKDGKMTVMQWLGIKYLQYFTNPLFFIQVTLLSF